MTEKIKTEPNHRIQDDVKVNKTKITPLKQDTSTPAARMMISSPGKPGREAQTGRIEKEGSMEAEQELRKQDKVG